MIFKRRWFKVLSLVFALVLFVGYFAFSALLFPPHEGRWKFDVASLIPREVDFFVAKAGLAEDFDQVPRLRVVDDLEKTEAWRTFLASPEFAELDARHQIQETLRAIRQQVESLPLGIDPLSLFGGREVAVAGHFHGATLAESEWAVYGRMNWMGKLGVSLLAYPGVLGLSKQGLSVSKDGAVFHLTGGQLAQPLWVTRQRDIAIVSSSPALVEAAVDLAARRGEGSLLLSSDYNDDIGLAQRSEERDEVEVVFDLRALLASMGHQGPLPDPRADRFVPALVGRIFQLPACKKVMGILGFHGGASLDVHGTFSSEVITDVQKRIYGAHGFGQDDILDDIATLAPADSALFVYLTGPIDVLLKQVLASMEPALQGNLQDAFRSTGRYNTLDELVDDISDSLSNRLALIVREDDYPPETSIDPTTGQEVYDGPPHDDAPVFSVALATWWVDEKKLDELQDLVGWNPQVFGLEGKDGQAGYYNYSSRGFKTREFWSRFVPGTGIIATLTTNELFYITNNHRMLEHLLDTRMRGGLANQRLSDRLDFREMVRDSIPGANMLLWSNPRAATKTLREQARAWAADNATRGIDWVAIRSKKEAEVARQMFPGRTTDQLNQEEQSQLQIAVDDEMRAERGDMIRKLTPQLAAGQERLVDYAATVEAMLVCLSLDQKEFRLSVRTRIPLD